MSRMMMLFLFGLSLLLLLFLGGGGGFNPRFFQGVGMMKERVVFCGLWERISLLLDTDFFFFFFFEGKSVFLWFVRKDQSPPGHRFFFFFKRMVKRDEQNDDVPVWGGFFFFAWGLALLCFCVSVCWPEWNPSISSFDYDIMYAYLIWPDWLLCYLPIVLQSSSFCYERCNGWCVIFLRL